MACSRKYWKNRKTRWLASSVHRTSTRVDISQVDPAPGLFSSTTVEIFHTNAAMLRKLLDKKEAPRNKWLCHTVLNPISPTTYAVKPFVKLKRSHACWGFLLDARGSDSSQQNGFPVALSSVTLSLAPGRFTGLLLTVRCWRCPFILGLCICNDCSPLPPSAPRPKCAVRAC
ncbi:hypothetical protein K437DRAFT_27094 [Tilletiaria anomala UBC 951]|uniref:Uncharacterized protein n=1 Tax=Tilletiaria anomala (strain ATCC 24038 / CBS 436.72 / UBC 951) TaxID=1037660 RepID=A0A066WEV3_TILAU|nr:uncharacterized protein K437DRAFT_27094 [Tilletiaria anomala UBC 951]KDN52286.1 hypothetical protein K437DRAFT_27094 [Tilletiaria anomala UBC 951]